LFVRGCYFDENVLYDTEKHVWARRENDIFVIGADTILVWLSGPLSRVDVKPPGTRISAGKIIGSLEGARHFDVVRSPLTGVVVERNAALELKPKVVNKDTFGEGWLVKISPEGADELGNLETIHQARPRLERLVEELRIHCFKEFPDLEMFEIGVECSAALLRLNELLERSESGTVVHIVSDDPTSDVEMVRWSNETGNILVEERREGTLNHYIVRKK
jgi:glycine cleavage system H protein